MIILSGQGFLKLFACFGTTKTIYLAQQSHAIFYGSIEKVTRNLHANQLRGKSLY